MSRAYQDYSFSVAEVEGRLLSRLIGAVDKGKDERYPCVVFAEFDGADVWHRFFLEAQIAFWETWKEGSIENAFDELRKDDFRLIDYSEHVGGLPQRLISAAAFENADALTHLRLVLESGARITLVPDSPDIDGGFHLDFD